MRSARPIFRRHHRRRGMIFVTALGVVVILGGLVLVFAQNMRVEAIGSINRLSAIQADAIEQGAEQWVLAQVEANGSDAVTITEIPAESLQVGKGYFWLLRPDPDTDKEYAFGIADESSKVNLNVAISDPSSTTGLTLLNLPGMSDDVADSIFAWRSPINVSGTSTNSGAQSDYYEQLRPQGYEAKNAPFETVEELFLVKDVTKELMFGYDLNRDGVIDDEERKVGGTATAFNSAGTDSRGLFNYVTVHSVEPNTAADGTARIKVNDQNTAALLKVLTTALQAKRAEQIMATLMPSYSPPTRGGRPTTTPANVILFPNMVAFYYASGMTSAEFKLVADQLTATTDKTLTGMVNVNTASKQALMCLPQMTEADAEALIGQRTDGSDTTSIAWVFDALTKPKALAIAPQITARSFQYSADIVAVSGDGRAFKRVRIVVDAQKIPAKIIYRRDLTSAGWPLARGIRDDLRSGRYQPGLGSNGRNGGSNLNMTGVH